LEGLDYFFAPHDQRGKNCLLLRFIWNQHKVYHPMKRWVCRKLGWDGKIRVRHGWKEHIRKINKAGSIKMNTALEYSTRVLQEGGRRCKKSTLNDLVHLTPLRIPLMNPPIESSVAM
jgi:hypothetical protein